MWNLPPPPGFQGLHPDKPVTVYVRHLPHWRQEGATYFVTFRLHDSLPQSKLQELDRVRHLWRVIQYIGQNPAKAGLGSDACGRWIRPEWEQLGWRFQSEQALGQEGREADS